MPASGGPSSPEHALTREEPSVHRPLAASPAAPEAQLPLGGVRLAPCELPQALASSAASATEALPPQVSAEASEQLSRGVAPSDPGDFCEAGARL